MNIFYNLTYTRGLAVTRLCIDVDGVVIEAEGYDGDLRKWAYHHDRRNLLVDWTWQ